MNAGTTGFPASAIVANSSTGIVTINGTPTGNGTFKFSVLVVDASGSTTSRSYSVSVVSTVATVTLNAGTIVQTVPTNFLGTNLAWWDPIGTTAQTQALVQAAGIGAIRITGGSSADTFHFTDPPPYGGAGTVANMATMISNLNATGIVTLNYGTGSPQEAAALIAYLDGSPSDMTVIGAGEEWNDASGSWINVDWGTAGYWASLRAATPLADDDGLNFLRIGRTASFGIRYFEIGNEVYGPWETDKHGAGGDPGQPHDPATYVAFARQTQALASQFASSISLGIDADETYDSAWVAEVLQQSVLQGFAVGWISDHVYMQEPGAENDSTLLLHSSSDPSSPLSWSNRDAAYRTLLQQNLGSAGSTVQILATEFNSVSNDPGKQTTSLVNGLFFADSEASLLQTDYQTGVAWDLHDGWSTDGNNSASLYGWRNGGDYGLLGPANIDDPPYTATNVPYPTYFADELVSKLAQGGGSVVSIASSDPSLSVYGVRQANDHLMLLVIDKSSTAAYTGNFQVSGFQPATQAALWQYGETQDTEQSLSTDGSSALATSTATLTVSGSSFSYQFPAYSMTVLDLAPNPQSTIYVSNTNFGMAQPPTFGQNIADADQGTSGSQAAVFGVNAFSTIALAQTVLSSSGTIVVNGGAYGDSLTLSGTQTAKLEGNVTVASLNAASGTVINLNGYTLADDSGAGNDVVAGNFAAGAGSLVKLGSGTLTLNGIESFTGATTVSAGSLIVNSATDLSSSTNVNAGAILSGVGTLSGTVTSQGTVRPINSGTPGTLTVGGLSLVATNSGVLAIDFRGADVHGTVVDTASSVNITGTTLHLTSTSDFPAGLSFTILTVPGVSGNLVGTFDNLPADGSTMTVVTTFYSIRYDGGDGNDIVLTTVAPITVSGVHLNAGLSYINSPLAANQHSIVENVVYSFSSAVSLSARELHAVRGSREPRLRTCRTWS